MKYPVSKPSLNGNELKYITKSVKEGWISSQGPQVKELEQKFAEYVGTKYAVACSSGTTALQLALAALKIGPGDEVIVPDFTMIATAWAVSYLGATPVFVDCGDDLNINVDKIEQAITPRTKAIIPVHIYGRVCDMDRIMELAYEYNLYVVEDAAEAHGATYKGKRVGSIGEIGCFSLFANKIISAGEGGLITTNSERVYKQLQHLKAMAFNPEHTFVHRKLGYNYRMTNLQACIALAQLERIDEIIEKRNQICKWYDEDLKQFAIKRPEGSVLWMYDIIVGGKRDEMVKRLKEEGIETRVFFKPMSQQPMYRGNFMAIGTPKGYEAAKVGMYLPTYTDLTREEVKKISNTFLKIWKSLQTKQS